MPARLRTNFPKDVKDAALARADGRCEAGLPSGERCPCAIPPGGRIFDHRIADRLGGRATLDNCQVICTPCDRAKFTVDIRLIAKVRGQEQHHAGTVCSRRPMQGGRFDPRSRGLDGVLRDRETGAVLTRAWSIDVGAL